MPKFAIELALARMALVMANDNRQHPSCAGLVHQVRRLEQAYRDDHDDRAEKLARLLAWYDTGGPEPAERIVQSFEEQRTAAYSPFTSPLDHPENVKARNEIAAIFERSK